MASRAEQRRERYQELISLNFSAKEARQLRDTKAQRRETYVESRRVEIEHLPAHRRTLQQQTQLDKIRQSQERKRGPQPRQQVEDTQSSESDRLEQFRQWSNKRTGGFPPNILRIITQINRDAGRNVYDHYGYRVFYWQYVHENAPQDARRIVEGSDS